MTPRNRPPQNRSSAADGRVDYSTNDLVSEQNGLRWIIVGVLVSLIVGFLFRGAYSPDRLTRLIRGSLSQLPSDVSLEFASARINLADGMLPDLSVVVEDIKISSPNECWGHPLLTANELRLPVSLRDLLKGRLYFRDAVLDQVELSLMTMPGKCPAGRATASATSTDSAGKAPSPGAAGPGSSGASADASGDSGTAGAPGEAGASGTTGSRMEEPAGAPPPKQAVRDSAVRDSAVRMITIGGSELSVHVRTFVLKIPDQYQTTLVFERSAIIPEGPNTRFEGTLKLSGESFMTETASKALVTAEYLAGPMTLNFGVAGNWREGTFEMKGVYGATTRQWSLQGNVKNLPVATMIPALRKYRFLERSLGAQQMWASAEFGTPPDADRKDGIVFELREVTVDGDLGEIEIPRVRVTSWFPLKAEPVDTTLRGLKLDPLLAFLQIENDSSFIGNRGTFNGKLHLVSEEELHLEGEHSGLEFVFSNRGVRRNQVISLLTGKADLVKGRWLVRVEKIHPLDGIFQGQIAMNFDPGTRILKGELQVDEMSLSPDVQRLMTGGGSLGRWSGALNFDLKDQRVISMTGELDGSEILMEGVAIAKTKLAFRNRAGALAIDGRSRDLKAQEGAATQWFSQFHALEFPLEAPTMLFRVETDGLRDFHWKLQPVQTSGFSVASEGGWDRRELLSGDLVIREKNASTAWRLGGSRATPAFEKK